jgi:hypothetical protein
VAAVGEQVAHQQAVQNIAGRRGAYHAGIDECTGTAGGDSVRRGVKGRCEPRQRFGRQPVIGVQEQRCVVSG